MPALSKELVQQRSSLMSGAEEGERLVKVVHEVLAILEDNGHVYGMKLKPSMVGVSPLNRDGSGLNPMDVTSSWETSRLLGGLKPVWLPSQWNLPAKLRSSGT